MNSKFYKYCIVPQCKSTTIKTPNKLFIHVPKKQQIRKTWLQLARRETNVSPDSRLYFCEDHFDLPTDVENYMEYNIMGFVSKIRLTPGCMPSKFDCQPDRRRRTCSSIKRPYIIEKQRMMIIEECLKESVKCSTSSVSEDTSGTNSVLHVDEVLQETQKTADKSVQVFMSHKFRSQAIQANIKLVDQASSQLKSSHKSVSTSPFKVKSRLSGTGINKILNIILTKRSDSDDTLYKLPVTRTESSPSSHSRQMKFSASDLIEDKQKQKSTETIQNAIKKIMNKPRFYIGVPKSSYFLIDIIHNLRNIPLHHLLLCLKKIRLDTKFQELADEFFMTPSYARKIFFKNVPLIASILRPFIVKLDAQLNKKTLPMCFRHKYSNVSCFIHCLEIEVQKPSIKL